MARLRRTVADVLERLAFAGTLLDDPRAEAFSRAAWAIRNTEGDLEELHAAGKVGRLRGVDKVALSVVDAVVLGRPPDELSEMEKLVPEGLFAIRRIKGLGPKKVKLLWTELQIETVGELEYACRENRLIELKGFGRKTQDKVVEQLEAAAALAGQMRRDRAWAVLEPVLSALEEDEDVARAEVVSDYARGLELVRDLAILVETDSPDAVRATADAARPPETPVTIHCSGAEAYGARVVWYTSSDGHRNELNERAEANGWTFDEAGLSIHASSETLGCPEEDDLYGALGLWPTELERRNDGVPLVLMGKSRPTLVTLDDLQGALHNHTEASDGSASLEDMRAAAEAYGLSYFGISEHSQSAYYAGGLDAEQLRAQVIAIRSINVTPGCTLLTGVESDIRAAGELDYEDDVLAALEVIVASVHRRLKRSKHETTDRMVAAATNRYTDIVGHPTGRLLLGREPTLFDMNTFLAACRSNGTAVELNANPARLDLGEKHLRMAKNHGVLVSISADAHSPRELEYLETGITVARRAGLTPQDVLNCRTTSELRAWITERRRPGK